MTRTATSSGFTASEICAIIGACHDKGVVSLKLGDLSLEFQAPQPRGNVHAGANQPADGETSEPGVGRIAESDLPAKAELSDEDRLLLNEARLAQLASDDPMAYEQEMIDALQ